MKPVIYLDNAATSWPKPPAVLEAIADFYRGIGANPGRSGHRRSVEAGRVVNDAREAVAELIGLGDPLRLAFCSNATEALNTAIHGLLRPGDRVATSSMEHNSMMRPLRALEQQGVIELVVIPESSHGVMDLDAAEKALGSGARLMAVNHASNVTGRILPIAKLSRMAHRAGALLLVDGAQSVGSLPVDMESMGIDLLAFTGHKGLLGPTGTGGLAVGPGVDNREFRPLKRGGTGSRSEREEQPDFLPDKLESGTLNVGGLAGLLAGVQWLSERGLDSIRRHEESLIQRLIRGLEGVDRVTIHGAGSLDAQAGTVSISFGNLSPSEAGLMLDEEFGVLSRVGLHCAPSAHKSIGSFPHGTVRLAVGPFTTEAEIDRTLEAVAALAQRA